MSRSALREPVESFLIILRHYYKCGPPPSRTRMNGEPRARTMSSRLTGCSLQQLVTLSRPVMFALHLGYLVCTKYWVNYYTYIPGSSAICNIYRQQVGYTHHRVILCVEEIAMQILHFVHRREQLLLVPGLLSFQRSFERVIIVYTIIQYILLLEALVVLLYTKYSATTRYYAMYDIMNHVQPGPKPLEGRMCSKETLLVSTTE